MKKKKKKSSDKVVSNFYNTSFFLTSKFYKPISKIIKFENA
jgi:hypothetical protein